MNGCQAVDDPVSIPLTGLIQVGDDSAPFIVGPENRLVEAAAAALSAGQTGPYNPLVLVGSSGTGKSHLARGLADLWKLQFGRHVCYTTGDDFFRDLTDAQETQAVDEFRGRHRRVDLLVLEHLERLAERHSAQEELLGTVDTLLGAGSQIVVTSADMPQEIEQLLPGLAGRLVGGLVVPLRLPGVEARAEILRRLAEERRLEMPPTVIRILAEGLRASAGELQGVIAQIEMADRVEHRPIDAELAREYVLRHRGRRPPEMRRIAALAARHFSLRVAELRSPSRRQGVVKARGVAMHLARQLTYESLQAIGQYFGGRDHTTVLHACRKIEQSLSGDPAIHEAVRKLRQMLEQEP
jgi:chromosomal replication initiator protein